MKATHRYSVQARLPVELEPLREIAMNLAWITYQRAEDLFHRLDPDPGDFDGLDPISKLSRASQTQLDELAADATFVARTKALLEDLRNSLEVPQWFQLHHEGALRSVAYFSPEYGIAQALPQYSGGLGVLAGDHLKSATDLGLPLTAIGLFYRHGYFTQTLDENNWQREYFPELDPTTMSLTPLDTTITVPMAGADVLVRAWEARVGRLSLHLLDTDLPENDDRTRRITDRLYGGGLEKRLRQEVVLGIGGIRYLEAMGIETQVFHMNEGHAGLLALERIRRVMQDLHLSFDEAVEAVRPGTVFTTHTPVPAGIDRFPRALIEQYLGWWCDECGVDLDRLMALGHEPGAPEGEELNMAVLGLRLAGASNGVSQLHGEVSRKMFASLWPGFPEPEIPIGSVTNGVHARTWVSREMHDLLDRHIGHDWPEAEPERWAIIRGVPNEQLRAVRATARDRLVRFARYRLRRDLLAAGASAAECEWTDTVLDPTALTIGFARRFATYKRATLLLRDRARLEALLLDRERPVQFVFAGKAHPADDPGKELLKAIADVGADPRLRHRFVFLSDYDIEVGRLMYQGVDVWLNSPIRPREACGTSGMKVVFNGALNCSVLDGWWDEMYQDEFGWAITSATRGDQDARDNAESLSLYHVLEDQIIPLFYEREGEGLPGRWLDRVRESMAILCPQLEASRMIRQYVDEFYEPAAQRSERMMADGGATARAIAAWKTRVTSGWPSVKILSVESSHTVTELGGTLGLDVLVDLGSLEPDDLQVQILHGTLDHAGEMVQPVLTPLAPVGDDSPRHFHVDLPCTQSGTFGYVVRAVPTHHELEHFSVLGEITWATDPSDATATVDEA